MFFFFSSNVKLWCSVIKLAVTLPVHLFPVTNPIPLHTLANYTAKTSPLCVYLSYCAAATKTYTENRNCIVSVLQVSWLQDADHSCSARHAWGFHGLACQQCEVHRRTRLFLLRLRLLLLLLVAPLQNKGQSQNGLLPQEPHRHTPRVHSQTHTPCVGHTPWQCASEMPRGKAKHSFSNETTSSDGVCCETSGSSVRSESRQSFRQWAFLLWEHLFIFYFFCKNTLEFNNIWGIFLMRSGTFLCR